MTSVLPAPLTSPHVPVQPARVGRPVTPYGEAYAFAPSRLTVTALQRLAERLAADTALWQHRLRYDTHERWFAHLLSGELYDVWLLSWAPGQSTSLHDHGGSSGAFHVLHGELLESRVAAGAGATDAVRVTDHTVAAGHTTAFGPAYVHDVRHGGDGPAASLHVYSPPLTSMTYYDVADGRLREVDALATDVPEPSWPRRPDALAP